MIADDSLQIAPPPKKQPHFDDQLTPDMTPLCPSDNILRDTLRGFDQETHSTELLSHLSTCRHCQDRIIESGRQAYFGSLMHRALNSEIEVRTPAPYEIAPERRLTVKPGQPDHVTSNYDGVALRRIDNYDLLELIGTGGSGKVYKARHIHLDRYVAVKLLLEQFSGSQMARLRFFREMKSIGRLDHSYIVRPLDAGECDNTLYLVMEFVTGQNVDSFSRRTGPLPVPEACAIIRQAALGLQHIHENGIVHRDLKPSNLLISRGGIKIADLGLALLANENDEDHRLTGHRTVLGTADYMAPEQAEGSHAVDIRADLYSLGCTLFRLLIGRPPYGGPENDTPIKKILAHASQPFPDLRALRPDVPAEVVSIVNKLTAKDRNQRYDQPIELVRALDPLCENADLSKVGIFDAIQPVTKSRNTTMVAPVESPDSSTDVLSKSDSRSVSTVRTSNRRIVVGSFAIVVLLMLFTMGGWLVPRLMPRTDTLSEPTRKVEGSAEIPMPIPIPPPALQALPPMLPIEARWRKQFPELDLKLPFPERRPKGGDCYFSDDMGALKMESQRHTVRLCKLGTLTKEDSGFLSVDIEARERASYGFFFGLQIFEGDQPPGTKMHLITVFMPARSDGTISVTRNNAIMNSETGYLSTTDTDSQRQPLTRLQDKLNLKVQLESGTISNIFVNDEKSTLQRRPIFPEDHFTGVYGLVISYGAVSYSDPLLVRSY